MLLPGSDVGVSVPGGQSWYGRRRVGALRGAHAATTSAGPAGHGPRGAPALTYAFDRDLDLPYLGLPELDDRLHTPSMTAFAGTRCGAGRMLAVLARRLDPDPRTQEPQETQEKIR